MSRIEAIRVPAVDALTADGAVVTIRPVTEADTSALALPRHDTRAVEDPPPRLGRLAEDLPEVAELDLDPVLTGLDGAVVVDAALRLAIPGAEPDPCPRRRLR